VSCASSARQSPSSSDRGIGSPSRCSGPRDRPLPPAVSCSSLATMRDLPRPRQRACGTRKPARRAGGGQLASQPGATIMPASRPCTYRRSAALTASFAGSGRRAARVTSHCAVVERYSGPPLHASALRRTSWPCARHGANSLRSAGGRCHPDGGFAKGASADGGTPPAYRNLRAPIAGDTLGLPVAASLDKPSQSTASCSCGLAWPDRCPCRPHRPSCSQA